MNQDVLEALMTEPAIACVGCGAAVAADQHYCLRCGAAQGDPRVPYRELLGAPRAAVETPPPGVVAGAPAPTGRDWTAVIALGGLATLALVLVVGVLIGKSGSHPSPAAVAPQVITVNAPAASAPAATTPAATTGGDASGGGTTSSGSGAATKKPSKALKDLQSTSGADYQKKSSKLPTTVAIPGKPPAKDNKPAGGGSGAETIG